VALLEESLSADIKVTATDAGDLLSETAVATTPRYGPAVRRQHIFEPSADG
jgi:hypothetical protein